MGKRRTAREFALKILYGLGMNPMSLDEAFELFWEENPVEDEIKEFVRFLVEGTWEKKGEIDEMIKKSVKNWAMDRLSAVDLNIIRMGAYEMLFLAKKRKEQDAIPAAVTINEAVEIAKKYGTPDSGKFVNGLLDQIRKDYCEGKNANDQ